jgi:hypothetical protein
MHADKDAINQRKRVHFVIELAWQADRGKLEGALLFAYETYV